MPVAPAPLGSAPELRQRRLRKIRMLIVLALLITLVVAVLGAWHAGEQAGSRQQSEIDRLSDVLDGNP